MSDRPADAARELYDIPRLLANLPRRIGDELTQRAGKSPESLALREHDRDWTYGELAATSAAVAQRLAEAGVRPCDRVMLVAENCAALAALLFGATQLDAWAVIVNARLSAREIDAIRDHCTPRRVVYLAHASPDAAAHASRHGAAEQFEVGTMGEAVLGGLDANCAQETCHDDPALDVAALVYTSGTTGHPKGVMLTHRNLAFIARVSGTLRRLSPGDRVYGVLPISHVYGLASVCLGTLFAGACLQLESRYSPEAMLHALEHEGITVMQGVPSMYAKLLALAAAAGHAIAAPALRFLYAGGSPLDPALKASVEQAFGLTLHNGYGLTESSPTITQTRLEAPRADCSVGTALPGVDLRIVDAQGRDLPAGAPGELWVRGPNVMRGYYRDPALTALTLKPGGWLDTGDLARQEADGALFIVGRTKDLVIRSGFNVYPVEVEAVLNAHPAVTHSAVVGRAVAGNEEVVAFVELGAGCSATPEELARFAAPQLAPYKRPAEIVILPSLPASATGKISKYLLRKLAQERAASALPATQNQ